MFILYCSRRIVHNRMYFGKRRNGGEIMIVDGSFEIFIDYIFDPAEFEVRLGLNIRIPDFLFVQNLIIAAFDQSGFEEEIDSLAKIVMVSVAGVREVHRYVDDVSLAAGKTVLD